MLKKQTVSRTKPKPQIWKKYIYIAQVRGPQSLFHKFYLHWTGQPHNIETEVRTYGKNAQLLHLVFFLSVHWLSLSSKYWSVSVTSEHCFQFSCFQFCVLSFSLTRQWETNVIPGFISQTSRIVHENMILCWSSID